MCGIFFALYESPPSNLDELDFGLLKKRGPNSFKIQQLQLPDNKTIVFASSVLALRGGRVNTSVTEQPLIHPESGNILLWNGELFASDKIQINENDGLQILNALCENYEETTEKDIFKVLEDIKGPYAFIFYLKKTNSIYFGRDRFGRRSLLIKTSKSQPSVMVSSVQVKLSTSDNTETDYEELKGSKVFKLELNIEPKFLEVFEWKKSSEMTLKNSEEAFLSNIECKISEICLHDSISRFNESTSLETDETEFKVISEEFYDRLKKSVMRRVQNLPALCKSCSAARPDSKFTGPACKHAKLAVLFSGGVDSTVLAALCDLCMPPDESIDLLNIAFEKQKKGDKITVDDDFMVPDRVSGLKSLSELNSERKWNFIEVNITLEELRKERDTCIRHLLFPHQSVLDDSIGCALWFASRGKGFINKTEEYTSQAEVLILGMGADEQLAGYARHRTRFENYGIESLVAEVKMEMNRISERNLGRDDRILSDHGKESRLPFLDEDLISFLNSVEIKYKCDMKQARGYGEKILLRKLAEDKFNLKFSASLQKRAIQFGSRVAKIENCKEKASDVCSRLTKALNIED